jgi:ABC-type phosphate/phosphonate transport system permease subunit
MKILITTVLVFFLTITGWQIYNLHQRIEQGPQIKLTTELIEERTPEQHRWADLVSLEAYCIEQRYHQANMVLTTRIWMAYLGFVTGMILCIVGAVFVISKMCEPQTDIRIETEALKSVIKSSSPGIIMAFLGTALITTTL